ncbi:MAG: AtpZ/AtpI family protein [Vampirovibrionales bacterium]|nr:AtpZ/AtpI family protein [Vampirovibrionales bacterium]
MDYAIQLLIPVLGGLMLAIWMNQKGWLSPLWVPIFPVLGLALGIGVVAKRLLLSPSEKKSYLPDPTESQPLNTPAEAAREKISRRPSQEKPETPPTDDRQADS